MAVDGLAVAVLLAQVAVVQLEKMVLQELQAKEMLVVMVVLTQV